MGIPVTEPTRFVICGVQRTGTTLLVGILDQHQDIVCVAEPFQNRNDHLRYSVPRYRLYVRHSAVRRALDFLVRGVLVSSYLDLVYSSLYAEAVGFKLMLDQMKRYPTVLRYLKRHRFRIVHIVRENPLRTHISRLRARKTQVYVSAVPVKGTTVRVDVDSLLKDLATLAHDNAVLTNLLLEQELELFSTSYERLSGEGRQAELQRILSFLGVDPTTKLKPRSVKLTPNDLAQVVKNYDEMADALKHTAYEPYLE
jgi:LPS sulfotransferase NodH